MGSPIARLKRTSIHRFRNARTGKMGGVESTRLLAFLAEETVRVNGSFRVSCPNLARLRLLWRSPSASMVERIYTYSKIYTYSNMVEQCM